MSTVTFRESDHSYTNDSNKRKYTSATTIISKFKQPFDKVAVSKAYAAKNGGTAEGWQKKWEEISNIACDRGTKFHIKKELEILGVDSQYVDYITSGGGSNEKRVTNVDFNANLEGVKTELVVYNHYFEIAGQVDVAIFNSDFFDLDDHKTNKKIDKFSYCHPRTGYKKMLFPVRHILDSNYWHYAIQLSLYAFMLEELTGKKARNLQFTHYPPDILEDDGISREGIIYKVPYLKKEVLSILAVFSGKSIEQYNVKVPSILKYI